MIMTPILAWLLLCISLVIFVASARGLSDEDLLAKSRRRRRG